MLGKLLSTKAAWPGLHPRATRSAGRDGDGTRLAGDGPEFMQQSVHLTARPDCCPRNHDVPIVFWWDNHLKDAVMRHVLPALLATAALWLPAAHAADAVSAADRSFVAMVSQGGMFEVKAGQLGADQGSSQDIRDQGTTEAHDHQLVGDKLKSIASADGIQIADTLNAQFQKELDDLKALSGVAFDTAYLRDMETIHAKDGAAFAKEAKSGTNPALRAFAAETHRIVERHIGELRAIGPEK